MLIISVPVYDLRIMGAGWSGRIGLDSPFRRAAPRFPVRRGASLPLQSASMSRARRRLAHFFGSVFGLGEWSALEREETDRLSGLTALFCRSGNQKTVQRLAGSKLHGEPAGLFSTTRPRLGVVLRISILRKHTGIRSAHAIHFAGRQNLAQPLFKFGFLLRYLPSQRRRDLLIQAPQLLCGHGFDDIAFHEGSPAGNHRTVSRIAAPERPSCKFSMSKFGECSPYASTRAPRANAMDFFSITATKITTPTECHRFSFSYPFSKL